MCSCSKNKDNEKALLKKKELEEEIKKRQEKINQLNKKAFL
jgi:hypothetical protein